MKARRCPLLLVVLGTLMLFALSPGIALAQSATPTADVHPDLLPIAVAIAAILSLLVVILGPRVPSVITLPVSTRRGLVAVLGFLGTYLATANAGAPWLQSALAALSAVAAVLVADVATTTPQSSTPLACPTCGTKVTP